MNFRKQLTRKSRGRAAVRAAFERLEDRTLLSTVVVNTTDDAIHPAASGMVSLRDAVNAANADTSTTITFSSSVFGSAKTITLAGTELELTNPGSDVTITGPAAGVTVSANNQSSVFEVDANVTASFSGLTISKGSNTGIFNNGALTLTHVTVSNNFDNSGGAEGGGGIYNGGVASLFYTTVTDNTADGYGGGIFNGGTLNVTNSTISNNTVIDGYNGGGIDNDYGTATLTDVTLSGNTAVNGGGFYNNDHADLINVTVANNTATGDGGGLENYGDLSAFNITVSGNHSSGGSGIFDYVGTTTIGNSIVAGNLLSAGSGPDVQGDFNSQGFNLIGKTDTSTGWTANDFTGTSASPLNPKLGALANNGGPTQTLLPASGSPAINHGSNSEIPVGITKDQRGLARIVGGTVDIGSVEVQSPPPVVVAPSLAINNVSGTAPTTGLKNFVFTVTRSGSTTSATTVHFVTADGTAIAGADYLATSGTLTFAPGVTTQTITVQVKAQAVFEPSKNFKVILSSPTNATITTATGIGTIYSPYVLPKISTSGYLAPEGNSGFTAFIFTVTINVASSQTITVKYNTADGTATSPSDFTATSGIVTFAPGQTVQHVTVYVKGDTVVEPEETFYLKLSSPVNATIAVGTGTGTIVNDDGLTSSFSINNVSGTAPTTGLKNFVFTVTRGGSTAGTSTVHFATANGTAISGTDYLSTSGTLTFAPGVTTETITVQVKPEAVFELSKYFKVNLSAATGGVITVASGTGTIYTPYALPKFSVSGVTSTEGASGLTAFVFAVTLDVGSSQTISVKYATANGSATTPTNYVATSGTLTFSPGQTIKYVTVYVKGGSVTAAEEDFFLKLSSAVNASIAVGTGTGMILK